MKRLAYLTACLIALGLAHGAMAQDEEPSDPKAKPKTLVAPKVQILPATPPAAANPPLAVPPAATADGEPADAPPPGTMVDQPLAVLQALDKITARIRRLTVKVGQSAPFGTLTIEVDSCRKAPPEDPPESAAFLKIADTKPGETPQHVFSGWMFASSPALSAMDHPVYDIWVVDCSSDPTAPATPAQ